MAIAFDFPPPALVAPYAIERPERVAGSILQTDSPPVTVTSPVTVLRCEVRHPPALIPPTFTIAFRISAAEVRDFALPKPTPRVFAQLKELTQTRVVLSWSVEGFGALYRGARGFDEVTYQSTYVAGTGALFVTATPAIASFSSSLRDDTQRASGSCQRVR